LPASAFERNTLLANVAVEADAWKSFFSE